MEDWISESEVHLLLTDAHAHLGNDRERQERLQKSIPTLVCAVNVQEAERLCGLKKLPGAGQTLIPTYGLHPWYAECGDLKTMEPFLKLGRIVGEIGMDSVWCNVPLLRQREVFIYQLEFASEKKKPVILHTKGQEKAIADLIGLYPNRYLVHWYSAEKYLEEYLVKDCYFSIGPDVWWNPAVQRVAKLVPMDRILIETDGMGAVKWVYEEAVDKGMISDLPPVPVTLEDALGNTLKIVANIRKVNTELLARQIKCNFFRFCGTEEF